MKLITFIKSYRIALFNVCNRVKDWKSVYLGDVTFPDNNDKLTFLFSNGYNLQPNDLGIFSSVSVSEVEKLNVDYKDVTKFISDKIDKTLLAREYINKHEKINEVSRLVVIFDCLLETLQSLYGKSFDDADLSGIDFNFTKDLLCVKLNGTNVYTNGVVLLSSGL